MNIRSKTFAALALALLPWNSVKAASEYANNEAPSYRPNELCVLDPDSGAGATKLRFHPILVYVLSALAPDTFAMVESSERCGDDKDNNCDGSIDEGCAGLQPPLWGRRAECDACMLDKCDAERTRCEGDKRCRAAVRCVVENSCLDRFLGPVSCLCGEGVSIPECQQVREPDGLQGACVEELLPAQLSDRDRELHPLAQATRLPANHALICLGRFCNDECAENIWNFVPRGY